MPRCRRVTARDGTGAAAGDTAGDTTGVVGADDVGGNTETFGDGSSSVGVDGRCGDGVSQAGVSVRT